MEQIATQNPSIASTYSAGKTYEYREIEVLVLKTQSTKRKILIGKSKIFIKILLIEFKHFLII